MSYELYRNTTLGDTLQDTLDELIGSQQITPGAPAGDKKTKAILHSNC